MPAETSHQIVRIPPDCGEEAAARGFSEMARAMIGSSILKIAWEVRDLKAKGAPLADLTVGDFDPRQFPIPEALRDEMRVALEGGQTNYPPPQGVPELRTAVQSYVQRTQGLDYPLDSVLIAGGARPALYSVYRLAADPGDVVVYPVPSWNNSNFRDVCRLQAREVRCRPEDSFQPTLELLAPHLSDARLLVLNSPQNPSGGVMPATEVERVGRFLVDENERRRRAGAKPLYLLYDQIYRALVFPGSAHFSPVQLVPECAPYVFHVDGISKFCAATGLRVGWLVAPPVLARKAAALLTHVGAWAPRPAQLGTAAFLSDEAGVTAWESDMVRRVEERLQALHEGLGSLAAAALPVASIAPQGAIYVSVRIDVRGYRTPSGEELATSEDVRAYLTAAAGFALVPFSAFGVAESEEDGWFRASVGAVGLSDIEEAIPRLGEALRALTPPGTPGTA